MLDVHSLEFYFRHDPQFEVAFTVNAEYHPTDSKHMAYRCFYETVTYDFLNQMCDGDKDSLQLILQMIGFFVLHVTPKRAFFWMGPAPASGKGVLLDLICRLLGSAQCCHIDAQKMGGKFSVSQLFNRRVNLGLESCGKLSSAAISTIKTLSGDSIMPIERKFKEGEDIPNYTKIVFASNEPINISESDMTDAFWDRCKLIFCGKSCAKNQRDPFLIDKLWEEREILMSVVAWEAHELILNDFRFIEPEISATIKHQWRYMNENPISTFLRERVKIHGKACSFISTEELFDAFIQYTGVTTMNIKSFSSQLTKYSPAVLMRKKGYAPDKRRVNGFVNIELVDAGCL